MMMESLWSEMSGEGLVITFHMNDKRSVWCYRSQDVFWEEWPSTVYAFRRITYQTQACGIKEMKEEEGGRGTPLNL